MKTARTPNKLAMIGALAAAMFAASLAPSYAFLDKTRFVAHLGVAYFCFHHWVMGPYQQGQFANGAPHRIATLAKGGAALLFAVHEVKVSEKIARNSKDPLLQKMDGGLTALMGSFAAVGQKLKSGHVAPEDIDGLGKATTSVGSDAAADGAPIKDVPVAIPGV